MMAMDAFVGLLVLVLLVLFVVGPWADACTDFARQVVFEKRDAIFDLAAKGELNFSSPEYRTIRSSLEKMIRFAHDLTVWRFVILGSVVEGTRKRDEASDLRLAVRSIEDEGVRKRVQRLVFEAHRAIILMMVLKSPILTIACLLVTVPVVFWEKLRTARRSIFREAAEIVQVEAEHAAA